MNKTTTAFVIISIILLLGVGIYYIIPEEQTITGQTIIEPLEKVKIGYREHLLYLPAYVAYAKGYYQQQGLDAEMISFDSTNHLVEAVLTGHIDAGIGGINALVVLTIEQKSPGSLKVFNLGYLADDFDGLLVAKDSNIKNVADLEGKTISTLPGTAAMTWMKIMLEKEGLQGKVNLVQTSPSQQLNVLASGSVDAIFVLEPLMSLGEEKGISKVLVSSPISEYYMRDMPFETSIMSSEFVAENPKTSKKIIKAVDKAIEFINNNPEQAKVYYSEFTPAGDSLEQKLPVGRYLPSDSITREEFQELADKFTETGLLEERVSVNTLIS